MATRSAKGASKPAADLAGDTRPGPAGRLYVIEARQGSRSGGLRHFAPGDLVPHATAAEARLLAGAVYALAEWWPGFPAHHKPTGGRTYPVLMRRPGTDELYVHSAPLRLVPLARCELKTALLAIHRCREADELKLAAQAVSPAVRAAAQAALQGKAPVTAPVALACGHGTARVIAADGSEEAALRLFQKDLLPLVRTCEDRAALRQLIRDDARPDVQKAAGQRLAELAGEAPEAAAPSLTPDEEGA